MGEKYRANAETLLEYYVVNMLSKAIIYTFHQLLLLSYKIRKM